MRKVIVLLVILTIAATAMAQDLGSTRDIPTKNTPNIQYTPPAETRQGGDTIGSATPIPGLPFFDTGTTFGFMNDYDEACPYSGSTSPDVVYSFTPGADVTVTVDLCGSGYDTKTYIYDAGMGLVACNDDFYFDAVCGTYVSKIEAAFLTGGATYYIIVDGYGGDSGDYVLNVSGFEPCVVTCPVDAVAEGEPPLGDGYDDEYNSGCNGLLGNFQVIDWTNDEDGVAPYDGYAWLCGKSGWHLNSAGGEVRDTDWFSLTALSTGMMEFTVESEQPCHMFKLSPLDCGTVGVELQEYPACGMPTTLTFPVTAGEEIWLWVGPSTFTGPVTEFTYFMTVSNNTFDTVPNEDMNWGQVKSLFR